MVRDLRGLEEMSPLAAVASRGVLEEQGDARACLLEVDAMVVPTEVEVDVASGRAVESRQRPVFSSRVDLRVDWIGAQLFPKGKQLCPMDFWRCVSTTTGRL